MVWKRMGDDSNLADSHLKWHSAKQCQVQSEKCVRVPLTPNVGDYQNIVIHREGVFISKFNYCAEENMKIECREMKFDALLLMGQDIMSPFILR